MSLTRQIRDIRTPVARFFRETCPNVLDVSRHFHAQLRGVETLRPPSELAMPPWDLIGHAIDYRIRYYFAITPVHKLVAAHGMSALYSQLVFGDISLFDRTLHERIWAAWGEEAYLPVRDDGGPLVSALALAFCENLERLIEKIQPVGRRLNEGEEGALCRHCYVLGLFERIAREGPSVDSPLYNLAGGATVRELLALPHELAVRDLCQLSWLFHDRCSSLVGSDVVLNPTFDGSSDVGGADADLIVNGCLIDLKAQIKPTFDARVLYQVLGYLLLDYSDRYRIHSVGVYMARQGVLVTMPVDTLLPMMAGNTNVTLARMREAFQEVIARQPAYARP